MYKAVPKNLDSDKKIVTVLYIDGSQEENCKFYHTPVGSFVEVSEDASTKIIRDIK